MYLSARVLTAVQGVNSYKESQQTRVRQGSPQTIYVQLVDVEQQDCNEHYIRYMPAANSSLTLTFSNLLTSSVVSKAAVQPYSQDPSIWSVTLIGADTSVMTGGNIQGALTENGVEKDFVIKNGLLVDTNSNSFC